MTRALSMGGLMNFWRLIPHRHLWNFLAAKANENLYIEEDGRLVKTSDRRIGAFNRLGLDIRVCLRCGRANREDVKRAGEALLRLMGLEEV